MDDIFNDLSDNLIPEFEVRHIIHRLHDMSKFDPLIDVAAEEREERAKRFQNIAKTLMDHIREQMFFCQRDFYRIGQLKRDLAGVCNKMDDLESRYRNQGERLRKGEEENVALKQQKNANVRKQVESMWQREQENVALLLQVEHLRAKDDRDVNHRECVERSKVLEKENAELIEQLSGLSSSLVQASLEHDCRSTIPTFWTMCILGLSVAVVVAALFYDFF